MDKYFLHIRHYLTERENRKIYQNLKTLLYIRPLIDNISSVTGN